MDASSPVPGLNEQQMLDLLVAMKNGDFSRRLPAGASGTSGQIAETFNALQEQLAIFTSECNRIAREIGTEGRFGGQAEVEGVHGDWKDLVDNLNRMSANITCQIRDLNQTVQALVGGNTSRKVTVPAAGETAELKEALNTLVEQQTPQTR